MAGWTELPGMELQNGEDPGVGRVIVLRGSRVEFVMTNAEGGW